MRSSSLSMRTRTSMDLPGGVSSAGQGFLQWPGHMWGNKVGDVSPERGQLLYAAGRQETVLGARHDEDGLDVWRLQAVELVHLLLVLEVGDRAQALDDRGRALLTGEVDDQDVERLGADVAEMRGRLLDERDSLL